MAAKSVINICSTKYGPKKVSKYTCTSPPYSLANFKIPQNVVKNHTRKLTETPGYLIEHFVSIIEHNRT